MKNTLKLKLTEAKWKPRYGHSIVTFKDQVLLIGGFGVQENNTHGRLKSIVCLKFEDLKWVVAAESDDKSKYSAMFTSWTPVSDNTYIVYGGRTSPSTCVNRCPKLITIYDNFTSTSEELVSTCDRVARYRHSAIVAKKNGTTTFVVFGGRTSDLQMLNDTWMISLDSGEREIIVLPLTTEHPCTRFSHSAAVKHKDSGSDEMWISGGLGSYGPLGDVWSLDLASCSWRKLQVSRMLPRFGHTSSICGDSLIMVGGVNAQDTGQPGVAVLNVLTGLCIEYKLPEMTLNNSMILINHSHILSADKRTLWIIGGGGNCFSFGTFFNTHCGVINLEDIL